MDDKIVKSFQELFKGRTDAWGSKEGLSNKETVTINHYRDHLAGKISLGIYPLLDDGTCNFFAIDLDKQDFDQALAIRNEFLKLEVHVYIAASKSKGLHIYGFPAAPVQAKDIRRLCDFVLTKAGVSAEIFPKQDYLDETIPLGNYINLPCYSVTRPFLTKGLQELKVEEAVGKIQRADIAKIQAGVQAIPVVTPRVLSTKKRKVTGKVKGKGKGSPPCIESILKGVGRGARDVAAFALARHYLDQEYILEEVVAVLDQWDQNNTPPLNDQRLLESKVRSAEQKGYAFGCSSITDEPLLSGFCKGECDWLRQTMKDRIKRGLVRELSFFETDTHLYEEIVDAKKRPLFIAYEKATKITSEVTRVDTPDFVVIPVNGAEIEEGAITLPTGVEPYGDVNQLVKEISDLIHEYVDLPPLDRELCVWYIMLSWVYDRLRTIGYLRFMGDTGVGKSRSLDVIGRLTYKPMMMSGAVTPAPIYRLIRRFRGTLILEEADFADSSEKSEVVTILNCGFERNRPVLRCSQDNPDNIQVLPCFGPKVFATRFKFDDVALEARCFSFTMEQTERDDIPPILMDKFDRRAENLRNKLLLWRLENLENINANDIENLDIGDVEPRLKQLGLPFALPFKDIPEVMAKFRKFMQLKQQETIRERNDSTAGSVLQSLFKLAESEGVDYIHSQMIAVDLSENYNLDLKANTVGKILNSLHIVRSLKRGSGTRKRCIEWNIPLMRKLLRRYILEPEEYKALVTEPKPEGAELDLAV